MQNAGCTAFPSHGEEAFRALLAQIISPLAAGAGKLSTVEANAPATSGSSRSVGLPMAARLSQSSFFILKIEENTFRYTI